jgi:hypothetical protein
LENIQNQEDLEYYINEEILTTKCPKCRIAYHDFDGCCALSCKSCRTYFCAYCRHVEVTNKEIHKHVLVCPLSQNQGDYFIQANNKNSVNDGFMLQEFKRVLDYYPIYFDKITEMMPKKVKEKYHAEIRRLENPIIRLLPELPEKPCGPNGPSWSFIIGSGIVIGMLAVGLLYFR